MASAKTPEEMDAASGLVRQFKSLPLSGSESGKGWFVETLTEVADFFGVNEQTVRTWRLRTPKMPGEQGRWPIAEIVRWRIDWISQTDLASAKRQQDYDIDAINLEMAKMELEQKRRQLLHVDDVELWASTAIVEFREATMQLKEMLTAAAPPEMKDFVRAETDRHLRDALTAATRRLELKQIGEADG